MVKKKAELMPYLLLLPSLIIYSIFFVYPNILAFFLSAFQWGGISPHKIFTGIGNYKRLFFEDPLFYKILLNTVILAAQTASIQLGIALVLAIIFYKGIKGGKVFATIIFLPVVVFTVGIGLIWKWMYNAEYGTINVVLEAVGLESLTSLWLADKNLAFFLIIATINWVYVGLYMAIYTAGLKSIPQSIFDAAKIDGLSALQEAFHITTPLLKPLIAVTMMMCIAGSFKFFDLIYVMTFGGPAHSTEILTVYLYRVAFDQRELGYASSIAVIIFLICFVVIVLQMKLMRIKVIIK